MTILLANPQSTGTCDPGIAWHQGLGGPPAESVCPNLFYLNISSGIGYIAINFHSRGKVGPAGGCGGSDTYVTFPGSAWAHVDVWKARRDGIWTGASVDISVYYGFDIGLPSYTLQVGPRYSTYLTKSIGEDVLSICPTTIRATATVFSDGTYQVT